jgi:hypothetical protein
MEGILENNMSIQELNTWRQVLCTPVLAVFYTDVSDAAKHGSPCFFANKMHQISIHTILLKVQELFKDRKQLYH